MWFGEMSVRLDIRPGKCLQGTVRRGKVRLGNVRQGNVLKPQSTCHQINVAMQEENICLKVLVVEVQIATSSRFPATIGCFLCCIY